MPAPYSAVATTSASGVDVELLEPGPEPSPLREFLDEHGEGLHHVMLGPVDDGGALGALERTGLPVLMHGQIAPTAEYAFFDGSDRVKVLLEAMRGDVRPTRVWPPGA